MQLPSQCQGGLGDEASQLRRYFAETSRRVLRTHPDKYGHALVVEHHGPLTFAVRQLFVQHGWRSLTVAEGGQMGDGSRTLSSDVLSGLR